MAQMETLGTPFSFTCKECFYRGDKDIEPEYARTTTTWVEIERYPIRCKKCKTQIKRYCRMKKSVQRLTDYSMERNFGFPKMLTVALPSQFGDFRSKSQQIAELRKKWRKLRVILKEEAGIDAGISVVECTSRVSFEDDIYGIPKYHAHIHAAVCMPYMNKTRFVDLCATAGARVGLGRLNIVGKSPGDSSYSRKTHLANYLSKYLSKDNGTGNASNFGNLLGYRSPERDYAKEITASN